MISLVLISTSIIIYVIAGLVERTIRQEYQSDYDRDDPCSEPLDDGEACRRIKIVMLAWIPMGAFLTLGMAFFILGFIGRIRARPGEIVKYRACPTCNRPMTQIQAEKDQRQWFCQSCQDAREDEGIRTRRIKR